MNDVHLLSFPTGQMRLVLDFRDKRQLATIFKLSFRPDKRHWVLRETDFCLTFLLPSLQLLSSFLQKTSCSNANELFVLRF